MAQRTQAERREATIAKLTEATIEAIAALGYPRATVQEIVGRAGVSPGALFRHFPSRVALVVHTAAEVGSRVIAEFGERWTETPDDARELLLLVRDLAGSTLNQVWRELEFNARTDGELRAQLTPVLEEYYRQIAAAADAIPLLGGLAPEQRHALAEVTIAVFHGENQMRPLMPDSTAPAMRMEMLLTYLDSIGVPVGSPCH